MSGRCLLLLVVLPLFLQAAESNDVAEVRKGLLADIAAAKQQLAEQQKRVQGERQALLIELGELQTEHHELAERLAETTDETETLTQSLAETTAEMEHQQRSITAAAEALVDLRRSLSGEFSLFPAQQEGIWSSVVEQLALPGAPTAEDYGQCLSILTRQSRQLLAGQRFSSQVVTPDGLLVDAQLVVVGPLAYAVTVDGDAGLAIIQPGRSVPGLLPQARHEAGIRELVLNGAGVVPVDPSEGDAQRLAEAKDSLVSHLMKGGVTMVPLLLLAGLAAFLAVYKLLSLAFVSVRGTEPKIAEILLALKQDRIDDAFGIARSLRKPLGPVICEGLEHREAPKEHIEELMYERVMAQVPSLERLLSPLAVCASVAPLLGLLGTVTGMIHTFRIITVFGTGDAQVLSGGISEALITTEVGLIIAVPALLLHAWLSRRVRRAVAATQQSAIMFVNGLKLRAEGTDHG